MKLHNGILGLCALLICSHVNAATIFAPTDGDVNFLFGNLGGGTLAMFDDSDQSYAGDLLYIPVPSIVGIAGPVNGNNDYIATNSLSNTLLLTGSDNFILGLNVGGTWLSDSSVQYFGANTFRVFFDNGGSVVQVDVEIMPAVPVPAAVWLFGSGLIGLAGVARRKNKKA